MNSLRRRRINEMYWSNTANGPSSSVFSDYEIDSLLYTMDILVRSDGFADDTIDTISWVAVAACEREIIS